MPDGEDLTTAVVDDVEAAVVAEVVILVLEAVTERLLEMR